jgi:hypothetical protein
LSIQKLFFYNMLTPTHQHVQAVHDSRSRRRHLGIGRVLRPGGRLRVRPWQERTEPLFQWAFEGCHVTRDIPALIEEGGFRLERMETG